MTLRKTLLVLALVLLFSVTLLAQEMLNGLQPIGDFRRYSTAESTVTIECNDNSQVRISVLAPDLVRIRTAFKKGFEDADHSWAIEMTTWAKAPFNVKETDAALLISTSELTVSVQKSPLLIKFLTLEGQTINADDQPMMFDGAGVKNASVFDPTSGPLVAASKQLGFEEHFYGLGEKAARLDKRRGQFVNWNSDTPGYVEGKDPIYQTIPFYIGWQNGAAYGIFFDNSFKSYFDFGRSSQEHVFFAAEGGEMNYYFFWGPSIKKILGRYADLTGHMPMPPRWALGNQQSRWSYYPERVAEEVIQQYRKRDLPLDVLHLDIDYMQGYRVFTFDTGRFPDPGQFTKRLASQGVKTVVIVDPGVKYQPPAGESSLPGTVPRPELQSQEKSYYVFNDGLKRDFFQKRADGSLFIPRVWPGESVFVDFTLPEARSWWGDLHRAYVDNGVAGIWNDMNEPSDFIDQTGKNQIDVISFDNGRPSRHARNRNVFALLMAKATYEGLERLRPDLRPYVITRAAYAGIQRYSTMWTGDTTSTWDALSVSVPMFQTLGLSGEPFVGSDVGGFIGRGNGELLVRSYQVSFLAPFCRNHKDASAYDQEPWRFGKHYEDIIRKYLKIRYRLLPYMYTGLEEAHRTGVPLFRPLLLNYQADYNTINLDDQFMLGDDLLVAPVMKPDITERNLYLPAGEWYDYWTGSKLDGGRVVRAPAPLETVPMYVRAGAILPMGPEMNFVEEKPEGPLTFLVFPDKAGRAATELYEDDGVSPAYKKGVFRRTRVTLGKEKQGTVLSLESAGGAYRSPIRKLIFRVRQSGSVTAVRMDGRQLKPLAADQEGTGWYRTADELIIRTENDGQNHRFQIQTIR